MVERTGGGHTVGSGGGVVTTASPVVADDVVPVRRYVHPDQFRRFEEIANALGFAHAAVGALVRSSYHADQQAHAAGLEPPKHDAS